MQSIPEAGPFDINPEIPVKFRPLFQRCLNKEASPRQAIKMHCLTCVGFETNDVANCRVERCPLHCYRPYQKASSDQNAAPEAGKQRETPSKVVEGTTCPAGG